MGLIDGSTFKEKIRIRNIMIRECFAEFLGTFLLCAFGCGSVAMFVIPPKLSSFVSVNLGWGFGATMGVWACGGVSGGHINPAVTLAMAIIGKTPWKHILAYWLGQYLGGFCAAACVYGVYYDGIEAFDPERTVTGENATAGIFGTYPQSYVSIGSALGDQIFGTMLLVLCVMALTDSKNMGAPNGLAPVGVGLVIMLIGLAFGANCGYPINPARDLSPRILTSIVGYGTECYSAYDYYFWIPIVGPHIGAVCGAFAYLVLVGVHIPDIEQHYDDDSKKDINLSELHEVGDDDMKYNQKCTNDPTKL